MDCFYINLERQADRREALELNFAANRIEGWDLHRFEAVNARDIEALDVPGVLLPGEKGCFLSHRNLIRESLGSDAPIMIMEDDALFGAMTCRAIDVTLAPLGESDWDMIFTDVSIGDVGTWPDFVRLRRDFERTRELQLYDLGELPFSGSTSYIVNGRFKPLLSKLLDEVERIDLPYDIYLRVLIRQLKLKAFVIVPFVTTISDLANQSTIVPEDSSSPHQIWYLFRRMIWMERNLPSFTDEIDRLRAMHSDDEARMFSTLFEALMSEKIRPG
jgi:GR25 family glycosyltransferase involved in LPS biosynthesis